MTRIGQAAGALIAARPTAVFAVFGGIFAAIAASVMWGFTVDDALISVRYARHLADLGAYRFDARGPATDGVTPLPWPFVLAVLARNVPAWDVLVRAKALGLACGALGGAAAGAAIGRGGGSRSTKALALVGLAASLPLAAHTVSGMETALATLLVTLGATRSTRLPSAALLGLAASLRPELLPFVLVLAALGFRAAPGRRHEDAVAMLLAATPFFVCAAARALVFGSFVPLSVSAKPSDATHGLVCLGAGLVVSVGPLAVLAPVAIVRGLGSTSKERRLAAASGIAVFVHLVVIVAVGGDWMPYARLFVPIVPVALVAAAELGGSSRGGALRILFAAALGVAMFVARGPTGREVMHDRLALVEAARPALRATKAIAALDIGWVSAATEAPIVDLAGLTDPEIAALRGGHTSKAVAPRVLLDRDVDELLVYTTSLAAAPPEGARVETLPGVRGVEARLLGSELVRTRFRVVGVLPLGAAGAGYVRLKRGVYVPESTEE